MKTPSVLEFHDYRSFLHSYAQYRRASRSNWSYGIWAKRLGLKATTSLTMILNGQRHPGPRITEELIRYFKLNPQEKEYFLDLIQLAKTKPSHRLRPILVENLRKLNPKSQFFELEEESFAAVSNWYHFAIQQMVRIKTFKNSEDWIQKRLRFPLSKSEIRKAIATAVKLKILKRDQNRLIHNHPSITTLNDVPSEALKIHHEQILDLARKAIRQIPVIEREFRSVTLSLKRDKLEEAKKLIRQFTNDIDHLLAEEGDEVYQLAIQFFPLSQSSPKKKKARSKK